ncbi:gas vesicle protein GvpG [Streptomyces triculaminicus]|uniref:Gas vesicle protein GvpG n=2 Tax=Streptomyces TaxID=1883 RepID=A0A939FQ48_9ACTN|nr:MULTISPECIES: gas vesicle protein GvpG [Streptomyces]MBO0655763.1 gas vesicle protein GvpG [Streptomyces triculaminicus]QSY49789.1 gas vesicle protein GvpG [Streptomyces griseocarneus]
MIGFVGWVLRRVVAEAERLYYDPAVVRGELKALEESRAAGRIDDEEFDRLEDALLDRLERTHRPAGGSGAT